MKQLLLLFTLFQLSTSSLFFHECYQGTIFETADEETGHSSLQKCYALQNECTWRYTHCLNGSFVSKRIEYGCSNALWGECQKQLGQGRNKTLACQSYESSINGSQVHSLLCCCDKAGCNGEQMEDHQIVKDFMRLLPEPEIPDEDELFDSGVGKFLNFCVFLFGFVFLYVL